MHRPLLLSLLLTLLAAAPASADESFLALGSDGRVARITEQTVPGTSTPRAVTGLQSGDRLVALGRGVALGRSGRLYRLDVRTRRATPTAARIADRARSFSLLASGDRVRVVSEQGLDVTADLATGALTPGPGLRLAGGEPIRPAVAQLADGRLAGVDLDRRTLITETAPGTGVMSALPLRTERRVAPNFRGPVSFVVVGTTGYLTDRYGGEGRAPAQSRFMRIDLGSGAVEGEADGYFASQFVSVLPLGTVAPDTTPPRVRAFRVPRTVSERALRRDGAVRVTVTCSEGCSVFAATAVGGRTNISNFGTRFSPGAITIGIPRHDGQDLRLLRRATPERRLFRVSVRDFAGNVTTATRPLRLVP